MSGKIFFREEFSADEDIESSPIDKPIETIDKPKEEKVDKIKETSFKVKKDALTNPKGKKLNNMNKEKLEKAK